MSADPKAIGPADPRAARTLRTGPDPRELLMDRSRPGRRATALPELDVPEAALPPAELLRRELGLPEVSEGELVRYFTHLSRLNYAVDTGFLPLGSCSMKYNPKWHEEIAALPGFAQAHPLQNPEQVPGALGLMLELQRLLAEITGFAAVGLGPAAGAQGELAGMLMIRSYHRDRGDRARTKALVPDSAHGTNPASAAMAGMKVVTIRSNARGDMDLADLRRHLGPDIAGLMLTMPTTLGLFDPHILEITAAVHDAGGLVYGDGANLNAILGRARFGDLGFDVVHVNLHKTFSTPHGGGGPGAGPVCCAPTLAPFLPTPVVVESDAGPSLVAPEKSIGRLNAFQGNFGVFVRAYAYIRSLGAEGLCEISENAVINANYLLAGLRRAYALPYDRYCMHEVVLSAARQRAQGSSALDIAKRLIDYGYHPPTINFPLIVPEALMIEPTETESRETLDGFIEALLRIAEEAETTPELLHDAPHAPMRRLDEARAARHPDLRWELHPQP